LAIQHAARSVTLPINFILASRTGNEVQSDYVPHLLTFFQLCVQLKFLRRKITWDTARHA
jgi:hypothetical protein